MDEIALFATDLDGTLLYDRENIAARDRDALYTLQDTGKTVVIATGREFALIAPAMDRLWLWDCVDYIIMAGGAEIYDVRWRQTLTVGILTPDMLSAVYRRYLRHPITVMLPQDDVFYVSRVTKELQSESVLLQTPLDLRTDLTEVFTHSSTKLVFHGTEDEVEAILQVMNTDDDRRVVFRRSHDNYIDCYAAGVSKSAALALLCSRLGLTLRQTAAIGDNHNDLDLLTAAGRSACPGDGVEEARRAADYICCPAREGAVADFCAWLGLI